MQQYGFLERDELIRHFMRISIRNVMITCYNIMKKHSNYQYRVKVTINSFARLVIYFVQCIDGDEHRITFLYCLMHDLTRMLHTESIENKNENVLVPYHSLLKKLLFELGAPNIILERIQFQVRFFSLLLIKK